MTKQRGKIKPDKKKENIIRELLNLNSDCNLIAKYTFDKVKHEEKLQWN